MRAALFVFTTALALVAAPLVAQETDAQDPYLWLEEIKGERALAQVEAWNAETEAVLTEAPEYPIARAWAKQILDDDRQIALPDAVHGDRVLNLWRDADNPRGLWRTASLASYLAGEPEWRTLIDVDALGEQEGEELGMARRELPCARICPLPRLAQPRRHRCGHGARVRHFDRAVRGKRVRASRCQIQRRLV